MQSRRAETEYFFNHKKKPVLKTDFGKKMGSFCGGETLDNSSCSAFMLENLWGRSELRFFHDSTVNPSTSSSMVRIHHFPPYGSMLDKI